MTASASASSLSCEGSPRPVIRLVCHYLTFVVKHLAERMKEVERLLPTRHSVKAVVRIECQTHAARISSLTSNLAPLPPLLPLPVALAGGSPRFRFFGTRLLPMHSSCSEFIADRRSPLEDCAMSWTAGMAGRRAASDIARPRTLFSALVTNVGASGRKLGVSHWGWRTTHSTSVHHGPSRTSRPSTSVAPSSPPLSLPIQLSSALPAAPASECTMISGQLAELNDLQKCNRALWNISRVGRWETFGREVSNRARGRWACDELPAVLREGYALRDRKLASLLTADSKSVLPPTLRSSAPSVHSTSSMPSCSATRRTVVVFPIPAGPVISRMRYGLVWISSTHLVLSYPISSGLRRDMARGGCRFVHAMYSFVKPITDLVDTSLTRGQLSLVVSSS